MNDIINSYSLTLLNSFILEWEVISASYSVCAIYLVMTHGFQWLIKEERNSVEQPRIINKLLRNFTCGLKHACHFFRISTWCLILKEISKFSFNPVWTIDISFEIAQKIFLLKFRRQIFYGFLYIVPIILFSVIYNIPKFLEVHLHHHH